MGYMIKRSYRKNGRQLGKINYHIDDLNIRRKFRVVIYMNYIKEPKTK
jgi:hypothetical protein